MKKPETHKNQCKLKLSFGSLVEGMEIITDKNGSILLHLIDF